MKFQRICYPYSREECQITSTTSVEGLLRPFIKEPNLKKFCMKSECVNVRILNQKLFHPIVPRIGFSLSCRVVIICFCKGLLYSCTLKYYTARTVENLQIDSLSELESLNCIVVDPALFLLTDAVQQKFVLQLNFTYHKIANSSTSYIVACLNQQHQQADLAGLFDKQ